MVWIKFVICASIVVFTGAKLSEYGDAIAEKTKLTGAWVGLLLLATITSMPELVAGISSVTIVNVPDLAVGLVIGSNLFNLSIIVILDVLHRPGPFLSATSKRHTISAGLCMTIISIAGLGIFISSEITDLNLGWWSAFSLMLLAAYMVSLRLVSRFEQDLQMEATLHEKQKSKYEGTSLRRTYINFAAAGLIIIGASMWLASIGEEIAEVTGWEASFVGSLFLAIISSLPELTVCIAALRLGAVDMAIADILGSNMFNTGIIIAISDLFYLDDSLLSSVSMSLAWAAAVTVAMTGIVILGILFRTRRKLFRVVSWEAPILITLYLIGAYVLFVS